MLLKHVCSDACETDNRKKKKGKRPLRSVSSGRPVSAGNGDEGERVWLLELILG